MEARLGMWEEKEMQRDGKGRTVKMRHIAIKRRDGGDRVETDVTER